MGDSAREGTCGGVSRSDSSGRRACTAGANDDGFAASLPAPYAKVSWTHLDYPGLQCQSGVVLERLAEVHVTGLTKPVPALAEVSCSLNHVYANLYVFVATSNAAHPRLIQRLTPATNAGVGEDMALATTANHVQLLAASGFHGFCCPTIATTYRWSWTATRSWRLILCRSSPR